MSEEEVNNELIAEYVDVLKTKLNHFVDEAVALKARLQYAEKGIQELQNEIGKRENDIADLKKQLEAEQSKTAQV